MSGLLAAQALAGYFNTVTLVDRDVLPDHPATRRGVPQGRHIHILTPRGSQALNEFFPGILEELVAKGAPAWTDGDLSKLRMSLGDNEIVRVGRLQNPKACAQYFASRPLIEHTVRQRVLDLPNIKVIDDSDVEELTAVPSGIAVNGARIAKRATGQSSTLDADLVVDATGRGSRAPVFLEAFGYGRPRVDEVDINLQYATQPLRISSDALRDLLVAYPQIPGRPGGMALIRVENDTWLLTLFSMTANEMPNSRESMLKFIEPFAPLDVYTAIRCAELVGEFSHYRIPSNRWRRYDRMARWPEGLIVMGDALCSFNPIYGQGMTVAALEAAVLRDSLRSGLSGLPGRFFRAAAKDLGAAWQLAVGSDLGMTQAQGDRSMGMRIADLYMRRLSKGAEADPVMAEQFLRVIGMIDPPSRLFHPAMMWRIITEVLRSPST